MEAVAVTDRGLIRARNEDSYYINDQKALFVLCDGMGGHKAGNVASQLAVKVISGEYESGAAASIPDALQEAIQKANLSIWTTGNSNFDYKDMGTTAVVATISSRNGELVMNIANVGDSRLYLIREDRIRQVTIDHTVAEQMRSQGVLTGEEAIHSPFNHVLTRALGTHKDVYADIFEEPLVSGDLVLMCSDGLSDMLSEQDLLQISREEKNIDRLSQLYLHAALEKGGHDNITLIIIAA